MLRLRALRIAPVLLMMLFAPLALPVPASTAVARIGIVIHIGKRSMNCRELGICSIDIIWDRTMAGGGGGGATGAPTRSTDDARVTMPAQATIDNGTMRIELDRPLPGREDVIPIDEDIVVDTRSVKSLRAERIIVAKGEYKLDRSAGKHGVIILKVRTE